MRLRFARSRLLLFCTLFRLFSLFTFEGRELRTAIHYEPDVDYPVGTIARGFHAGLSRKIVRQHSGVFVQKLSRVGIAPHFTRLQMPSCLENLCGPRRADYIQAAHA